MHGIATVLSVRFAVLALLTCALAAQHPAGLLAGMPPPGVQLTTVGTSVGSEVMARIPGETYRGLGEFVAPQSHRIRGAVVHLRDLTLADGELFDVHLYLEAGVSNLPTIPPAAAPGTTAIASAIGVTTPQGIANHEIAVVFPTPADVPIGRDIFVSVVYHTPGLVMRTLGGTSLPGFVASQLDSCGAGLPLGSTYMLLHELGVIVPLSTGFSGWQPMIDLLVDGSSGVGVAAVDGVMPPTASMFSGLYPDVADPPNQTARHDVPGYRFRGNGTLPAGAPVFLLASTGEFAGAPWIVLSPGNAVLHLSPVTAFSMAVAVADSAGDALLLWPVPQSAALRGVNVSSQAFGFDLGNGAVRAGAAVRQRF